MQGAESGLELGELRELIREELEASVDPREARRRGPSGIARIAESALELFECLPAGEIGVRVRNLPPPGDSRTSLEVVLADGPFVVDTLRLALRRLGLRALILLHPLIGVERDERGEVVRFGKHADANRESYLYCEVPRIADEERLESIARDLRRTFGELQRVVRDHQRMVHALRRHTAELGFRPGDVGRAQRLAGYLEWLADDNFVFLGYRRYRVRRDGAGWELQVDAESGLGMLAEPARSRFDRPARGDELPGVIRDRLGDSQLVFFDKSRSESVIHRSGRLDSISIKMIDASGQVCGFGKILGLLTHKAVRARGSELPLLDERCDRVLKRIGADTGSYDHKSARAAFDSLPVEFLFAFDDDALHRAVRRIMDATHAGGIEVLAVPDPFHRSYFVSAALPRSNYEETLHDDLRRMLTERYGATYVDSRASFFDDSVALLHFFCSSVRDVDPAGLPDVERAVRGHCESWSDRFEHALLEAIEPVRAYELVDAYASAFPAEYRVVTPAAEAVEDVQHLERLRGSALELADPVDDLPQDRDATSGRSASLDREVELAIFDEPSGPARTSRLKLYLSSRPFLTDLLPAIDHFGVRAVDATLTQVDRSGASPAWIVTFRIVRVASEALLADTRRRVLAGLRAVLDGRSEDDALNRLVIRAGLEWRNVELLRSYLAYAAQIGRAPELSHTSRVLLSYPNATRALLELFRARFDPDVDESRDAGIRDAEAALAREREPIATFGEDRVYALLSELIRATSRTNYYAASADTERALAAKLDPSRLERLESPAPFAEIFAYAPDLIAVHLRDGPLARGGIRWSDRVQDLRSEIYGLWRTQRVKNGLIVPAGAKGGFALKRRPSDPDAARVEAERQYARFMRLLLSLTDDVVDGNVCAPDRVVRHDGDDPYLVVAPDRGTAHLSDRANEESLETGFWLGDAFASGGSEGYDHKREGITARGAWVAVQRHFRELGMDVDAQPFTVAGIGDLSGDVFGNGMVRMRRAKLLAAFDQRHVFVDPDPDPERAWNERRRIAELERSTWADYDRDLLSAGGGVWERSARQIPLSPQARRVLAVEAASLSGEELVRAILRMPVDLLWNGGIGTYVKASWESAREIGDRANAGVRVDARELRTRVVGEGGNLGLTQAARVEFALAGGAVNTDAIDNAAGVDLSDHEVNLKVLLREQAEGPEERRPWLRACLDPVVQTVLAHAEDQTRCLSLDRLRSREAPERLLRAAAFLSRKLGMDWRVERLADRDQLLSRTSASSEPVGYTRPELAVLLGYTKMLVKREVVGSPLVDDDALTPLLESYFPDPLRVRFASQIAGHPLRREVIATVLTNRVIDHAGSTLVPELAHEIGASIAEIVCATHGAEELLDAARLRAAVAAEPVTEQERLRAGLWIEQAVRDGARNRLGVEHEALLPRDALRQRRSLLRSLQALFPNCLGATELARLEEARRGFEGRGFSHTLATDLAALPALTRSLGVISLAVTSDDPLPRVARLYARVAEETRIAWLLDRLASATSRDGWDRVARDALSIELLETQARVTARVLDSGVSADAPQLFSGERRAQLDRIDESIGQVDGEPSGGLAGLVLVSRQIRRLC